MPQVHTPKGRPEPKMKTPQVKAAKSTTQYSQIQPTIQSTVAMTLPQMVDLSLCSTEMGTVNFSVLHALLHVLIKESGHEHVRVEFIGKESDRIQTLTETTQTAPCINLKDLNIEHGKEAKAEEERKIVYIVEPTEIKRDEATFSVALSPDYLHGIEADINTLKHTVQELKELPGNLNLIQAVLDKNTPILDMFQMLSLNKRVKALEQALTKLTSIVEDLIRSRQELMSRLEHMEEKVDEMNEEDEDFDSFLAKMPLKKALAYIQTELERLAALIEEARCRCDVGALKEALDYFARIRQIENDLIKIKDFLSKISLQPCTPDDSYLRHGVEPEVVKKLQNRLHNIEENLTQLRNEMVEMLEFRDQYKVDKEKFNYELKCILETIDLLKIIKADREELYECLREKADLELVNRKVSRTSFDKACEEFSSGIDGAFAKLTAQMGTVNFSVLHALLHIIIKEIHNKDIKVQFLGKDGDKIQGLIQKTKLASCINLKEIKIMPDITEEIEEEAEKGTIYIVNPADIQSPQEGMSIALSPVYLHQLERNIKNLEIEVQELRDLPGNLKLIQATLDKNSPIVDMFQILTIQKKVQGFEESFEKLIALIEGLIKEKNDLLDRLQLLEREKLESANTFESIQNLQADMQRFEDLIKKLTKQICKCDADNKIAHLRDLLLAELEALKQRVQRMISPEDLEEFRRIAAALGDFHANYEKDMEEIRCEIEELKKEIEALKINKIDRKEFLMALENKADISYVDEKLGTINFTLLHALLQILIKEVVKQDIRVEFLGKASTQIDGLIKASSVMPCISLKTTEFSVPIEKPELKQAENEKKLVYVVQTAESNEGESAVSIAMTPAYLENMEKSIAELKSEFKELRELPANLNLTQATLDRDSPILDMFQILGIKQKLGAVDDGLYKLGTIVEDLIQNKSLTENVKCQCENLTDKMDYFERKFEAMQEVITKPDHSALSKSQLAEETERISVLLEKAKCVCDPENLDQIKAKLAQFEMQINKVENQVCAKEKKQGASVMLTRESVGGKDSISPLRIGSATEFMFENLRNDVDDIRKQLEALLQSGNINLEHRLKEIECNIMQILKRMDLLERNKADYNEIFKLLRDKPDINFFERKEEMWLQALEDLQAVIDTKIDKSEFALLKEYITKKLKSIQAKLNALKALKQLQEAAAGKLMKDVNCLSCDYPTVMKRKAEIMPKPFALPPSKNIAPYLAYELDQIRTQQKWKNYHRERTVGGNFTITNPAQRVTRVGNFKTDYNVTVTVENNEFIRGIDNRLYKAAKEFLVGPNIDKLQIVEQPKDVLLVSGSILTPRDEGLKIARSSEVTIVEKKKPILEEKEEKELINVEAQRLLAEEAVADEVANKSKTKKRVSTLEGSEDEKPQSVEGTKPKSGSLMPGEVSRKQSQPKKKSQVPAESKLKQQGPVADKDTEALSLASKRGSKFRKSLQWGSKKRKSSSKERRLMYAATGEEE